MHGGERVAKSRWWSNLSQNQKGCNSMYQTYSAEYRQLHYVDVANILETHKVATSCLLHHIDVAKTDIFATSCWYANMHRRERVATLWRWSKHPPNRKFWNSLLMLRTCSVEERLLHYVDVAFILKVDKVAMSSWGSLVTHQRNGWRIILLYCTFSKLINSLHHVDEATMGCYIIIINILQICSEGKRGLHCSCSICPQTNKVAI